MNHETPLFQTLEPPKTPWTRWVTSFFIHTGIIALMIAIPVAIHEKIQPRRYNETRLVAPAPLTPPPPMKIKAPKPLPAPKIKFKEPDIKPPVVVKKVVLPPPEPPKIEPRKVEVKIEQPKVEVARVILQPKFDAPVPTPAQPAPPRPAVKTEVFAANAPAPMGAKREDSVKMGGFGDPNGVKPSQNANAKGTIAALGGFDMPQGSGNGGRNGTGRVVASAGFGNTGVPGNAGYGSAGPRATVQNAGFNQAKVEAVAARSVRDEAPSQTPVEIISKPKPVYTAEARQMKLEGEVLLEVVFSASGQIQVVRTVRGLGHGLDETAREAAQQIKFRPGTRGGAPADMKGIVHIVFELS